MKKTRMIAAENKLNLVGNAKIRLMKIRNALGGTCEGRLELTLLLDQAILILSKEISVRTNALK